MYKITGAKYRKDTREVVGYIVSDGNTNEVLAHNMVYWLVKAGLISNATAKEDGDKLIVETDAIIGSEFTSEDFQIKTEKIYEAIRKLNNEYAYYKGKKILLLGGSAQQIVAIEKARNLGYYTILCDYLSDNPGQYYADKFYMVSTTDKNAVLNIAIQEQIDGILAYASEPAEELQEEVEIQLLKVLI